MKQIWLAWSRIYFRIPEDASDIVNQFLWGNLHIRRAGSPIFSQIWMNQGLDYVYQLKHEKSQRLLTYQEAKENFGFCWNVLQYNSIISALPVAWKNILKYQDIQLPEFTQYKFTERFKTPTKEFYWHQIDKKISYVSKYKDKNYWESELNVVITDKE